MKLVYFENLKKKSIRFLLNSHLNEKTSCPRWLVSRKTSFDRKIQYFSKNKGLGKVNILKINRVAPNPVVRIFEEYPSKKFRFRLKSEPAVCRFSLKKCS